MDFCKRGKIRKDAKKVVTGGIWLKDGLALENFIVLLVNGGGGLYIFIIINPVV